MFAASLCVVFFNIAAGAADTKTGYLRGDSNGDGIVSISDATAIQRFSAQYESISGDNKAAADVDCNGVINVVDATEIQRFLAGFENIFEINIRVNETAQSETTQPVSWYKPGDNQLPFV